MLNVISRDLKKVANLICELQVWYKSLDNFFDYMMKNFETEITVMGARTALTTYDLKFSPTKLKSFDKFHDKYGKYILKAAQ